MGYRLLESSSDIVVEADAADLGGALVGLAQGFTHVTTAGDRIEPRETRPIDVSTGGDLAALAVAFVNELVFLFGTDGFLATSGRLGVDAAAPRLRVHGVLAGERFDPARHRLGTEVKAATFHDAVLEPRAGVARARVLLDL